MIVLDHDTTKIYLSPNGRAHVDGRDLVLDGMTLRRLLLAVEPDRLRNLGATVGIGDQTSTFTIGNTMLVVKHKGDRKSIARSVRKPMEILLGLAEVMRGHAPYEEWLKRLPIPIETENLVVRFRLYEPRCHEEKDRYRWTSLFTDGTVLRFSDAGPEERGHPIGSATATQDIVVRIATLVAQVPLPRSADATIEDDEDRRVTLEMQRPVPRTGELLLGHFAWSFWAGAAEACRQRIEHVYARGEHELVYALYEQLVTVR